jgi:hypothetical protein
MSCAESASRPKPAGPRIARRLDVGEHRTTLNGRRPSPPPCCWGALQSNRPTAQNVANMLPKSGLILGDCQGRQWTHSCSEAGEALGVIARSPTPALS